MLLLLLLIIIVRDSPHPTTLSILHGCFPYIFTTKLLSLFPDEETKPKRLNQMSQFTELLTVKLRFKSNSRSQLQHLITSHFSPSRRKCFTMKRVFRKLFRSKFSFKLQVYVLPPVCPQANSSSPLSSVSSPVKYGKYLPCNVDQSEDWLHHR